MAPNDTGPHSYRKPFRQVLADAVAEISASGYTSPERIQFWVEALRRAAEYDLGSETTVDRETRAKMEAAFKRLLDGNKITELVPGVSRFNLSMLRPSLRAELDRRIVASADLIKLHRREAIEKTLSRFSGWSTSIPAGGDGTIDKREVRSSVGKSVAQLKFEARRVSVDQGHKLIANISEIVAMDGGAIAGIWHDHGEHDSSYNARKEHLERSKPGNNLFLVRDSWAIRDGLIRRGSRPYMDEIERPGQLTYCRCYYVFLTSPRRLPDDVLTARGHEWVSAGRVAA